MLHSVITVYPGGVEDKHGMCPRQEEPSSVIFTERGAQELRSSGVPSPRVGPFRNHGNLFSSSSPRFLLQSLEDLDASLRKVNSRLFVIRGQPANIFPILFKVRPPAASLLPPGALLQGGGDFIEQRLT